LTQAIVYVEGASDSKAMYALFNDLILAKRRAGVNIKFHEPPSGDRKRSLLVRVPRRAVDILHNNPHALVVVVPDLYPRNKAFPHETFDETCTGILGNFEKALRDRGLQDDDRFRARFRVFCFKYDLEVLILASQKALARQLGVSEIEVAWTVPVEDQNHERPPKRVVEELFRKHRSRYKETIDAAAILGGSSYVELAGKCPQCFKPFVEFLEGLQ